MIHCIPGTFIAASKARDQKFALDDRPAKWKQLIVWFQPVPVELWFNNQPIDTIKKDFHMKIQCRKCKRPIPTDQINVSKDIALCPDCGECYKISECVDLEPVNPDIFRNPPGGVWFRQEPGEVVIGATTRSPAAFFLVPFMCVWSGGSLGGIYGSQIASGEFNPAMSLFGIPFLIGTIVLGAMALMTVFGKIEVHLGRLNYVFTGIGPIGWKRPFDWSAVHTVREVATSSKSSKNQTSIVLEGETRVSFGAGLNDNRKYFILNALKFLKAEQPGSL
jgi:hypothetical protein